MPLVAFAGEPTGGSYQFASSCGSQGPWTQQALQKTSELRSVLSKLQALPECKTFAEQMQASLDRMQTQLGALDQDRQSNSNAAQLPGQVDALRTSLVADQSNKGPVLNAMFSRMIETAKDTQPELKVTTDLVEGAAGQVATALGRGGNSSVLQQISSATTQSLQIFNDTIDYLPQVQSCLTKSNLAVTGQMMSASVQILSALSNGGQSKNSLLLAKTVSKLANFLRQAPFANALKTLNNSEFTASLACLLEMTSENYCSARDAHLLFDQLTGDDEVETGANGELRLRSQKDQFVSADAEKSPLAGYYLLTQNLPIITDWIQMIQLGAEPRLSTDADQKNGPINQISNFQMTSNSLKATANTQLENIRSFATLAEKQNAVISMVIGLYAALSNSGGGIGGNQQNFFTLAMQPVDIIFYLLGVPTPDAVRPISGQMQPPDQWLQNNYKSLPIFGDPTSLSINISANLTRLIEQANRSSITYYNKWFIVDKVLITNRALIGINYNVKDALRNTSGYLTNLQNRVTKYSPDDLSIVPLILETRERVDKVLQRFADIESLGKSLRDKQNVSPDSTLLADQLPEALIAEVYNQFYVMLAKSGWLASRMADFVTADFQMMRRAGVGLDPYLNEIYAASGRMLGDEIVRMSGSNPAAVKTDLSMALYVGKGNLEAIATGLSDAYLNEIALLQEIIDGRHFSDSRILWQTEHPEETRWLPEINHYPDENRITNNGFVQVISGIYRSYLGSLGDVPRMVEHAAVNIGALSETLLTGVTPLSPDDEFGSAKSLQAQLCVQTLAFANLGSFWSLCKNTKLTSPYANTPMAQPAAEKFDAIYNVNYHVKAWQGYKTQGREANLSNRICAFRDYNRRNLILYLTKNAK